MTNEPRCVTIFHFFGVEPSEDSLEGYIPGLYPLKMTHLELVRSDKTKQLKTS